MSKAIVDKILAEMLYNAGKRADKKIRDYLGVTNPHFITISYENIEDTVVYNFIRILYDTEITKLQGKGVETIDIVKNFIETESAQVEGLKKIAKEVWNGYIDSYNSKNKYKARLEEGNVVFWQASLNDQAIKQPLFDVVIKHLNEKQYRDFTRQTQFLHKEGTTVGLATADILRQGLSSGITNQQARKGGNLRTGAITDAMINKATKATINKTFSKQKLSAFRDAGEKAIESILNALNIGWESVEEIGETPTSVSGYTKNIVMKGTIGPTLLNKPGKEPEDWKNLGPRVAAALTEEFRKDPKIAKLIDEAASMPPKEKVLRQAAVIIANNIEKRTKKTKNVKIDIKVDRPDKAKSDTSKLKSGKKTKIKRGKLVVGRMALPKLQAPKRKVQQSAINPLGIIKILNNQIEAQVLKNMVPPRLENQTGRFAQSVKVVDVVNTGRGFASIGYTYDKYPYQVFETGHRQGTTERDPRHLIDKSIREIAAEMALGRFYTRRI